MYYTYSPLFSQMHVVSYLVLLLLFLVVKWGLSTILEISHVKKRYQLSLSSQFLYVCTRSRGAWKWSYLWFVLANSLCSFHRACQQHAPHWPGRMNCALHTICCHRSQPLMGLAQHLEVAFRLSIHWPWNWETPLLIRNVPACYLLTS